MGNDHVSTPATANFVPGPRRRPPFTVILIVLPPRMVACAGVPCGDGFRRCMWWCEAAAVPQLTAAIVRHYITATMQCYPLCSAALGVASHRLCTCFVRAR